MGEDIGHDPLQRDQQQDHLTREAVLHAAAIREMLKVARGLSEQKPEEVPRDA